MGPFDVLKALTYTKTLDLEGEEFEKAYIPFLINKGLSLYADTVLFANDMNLNSHIPNRWQYDYLFYTIKPRKRYEKWPKKIAYDENLELVKQHYGYSTAKAKQALLLLNESQIKTIKTYSSKGGIVNDE
jgi:clamp loader A subunit